MRFLLCPMGSAGDVFPFLGLAGVLRDRGHEVTLMTSDYFEKAIVSLGFPFERLGEPGLYQRAIHNADLWHSTRGFEFLYRDMVQPVLAQQFERTLQWCLEPDSAVVISCWAFGALCALDAADIPVYSVHLQPAVVLSKSAPPRLPMVVGPAWLRNQLIRFGERFKLDPVVFPTLNAFRQSVGLSNLKGILSWWYSSKLNIMLFPDWYAPQQPDWPQPCVQTSFPLWELPAQVASSGKGLPLEVEQFLAGGPPPIAITTGSANIHSSKQFDIALKACQLNKQRLLFLTPDRSQLPDELPPWALACPFVPLGSLLPQCSLIINHGGIGTVSQAIAAAIPQIVIPLAHDQFDNAQRVVQLQLGLTLSPVRLTSRRLVGAIERVTSDVGIRTAVSKRADLLRNRSGLVHAAIALEQHNSP